MKMKWECSDPIVRVYSKVSILHCNHFPFLIINHNIDGFKLGEDDIEEFVDSLEGNVYNFTIDYIKKVFRDINTNLLRKFCFLFKKEEEGGKNRDWRSIEETKIRELFVASKKLLEEVIGDFKYIKIPKQV